YLDQSGKLKMSPVSLGITDGKQTEIVRGKNISEGMKIITGILEKNSTATTTQGNSLIQGSPTQQRQMRRGI
ncbi:MAG: hypothetical protein Q8903_13560, partial [Bacteroidota bacterium]|nr:hypothetical protein [Bacteroidota bacterium]